MNPQDVMGKIQFLNKYSLYNYDLGRRETWEETVQRVMDYFKEVGGDAIPQASYEGIHAAIVDRQVTPSMRLMATAGKGARRNQISIYNCSAVPLQSSSDFHNLAMLLGHGVGVGLSVEDFFVRQWNPIGNVYKGTYSFIVPDDIEGWAFSFKALIDNYYEGYETVFDYSLIRPSGTPLKTRGGHASGPEFLKVAHERIAALLKARWGQALRSIDLFDMACHVAECIVSGGHRRSALLILFDKDDSFMLEAKSGAWWDVNPQRSLANISQVVEEYMTEDEWLDYVLLMDKNKSGEPGIWSRYAIRNTLPTRRTYNKHFMSNPCAEQILRPYQLCNLNQVIARPEDTFETLSAKMKIAALIGTLQSAMVEFNNVNPLFVENSVDERLLGVSISGIMDCPVLASGDAKVLEALRNIVVKENKFWAKKLKINPSTSTTCVKPDGNTSVLYDTSPGVHGRYAPFYTRRMQVQAGSPVANFALASGIPAEPKVGESWENVKTLVLAFPVKAPGGAAIQRERSAVEQLENWLQFKKHYTETNPSVTIMYRPDELEAIASWLYVNQENVVGLSFLPADDHTYVQAPYEEISEAEYEAAVAAFPAVDFDKFWEWEVGSDTTQAAQNLACVAGACIL